MTKQIRLAEPCLEGREIEYVTQALQARTLSRGTFVERFEEAFAAYTSVNYAIACCNGTAALHTALNALGVRPGERVVVPATTYIATANAVTYCGATPHIVDVQPGTWTINWTQVQYAMLIPRTVGVIPVHLYGVPAGIGPIGRTFMLEDAAEAHGATYEGKRVGSIGQAGVFSFYGNKIITCGEGGMVTTNDRYFAARCRKFIGVGQSEKRYIHDELGYNYRMTEMCGAIGLAQLERIEPMLARRKELGDLYRRLLPNSMQQMQVEGSVDWVFPVLVQNRNWVAEELVLHSIQTRPIFPPLHHQPIYFRQTSLPVSENIGRDGLLLPLHPGMSNDDVERVCSVLMSIHREERVQ